MDAKASKIRDVEVDNLFGFYLKTENASYPHNIKQKKTVIKYTKLPGDINSKASWTSQGCTVEPRFRRIITIEEPRASTRRSLKSDVITPTVMASDICKRKIVTIEEDDGYSFYPKYSHHIHKNITNVINRAVDTREDKPISQQKITRLSYSSRSIKDVKSNNKSIINVTKELSNTKSENRHKLSKKDTESKDYAMNKSIHETSRSSKNFSSSKYNSINKKIASRENIKEEPVAKNKLKDERLTKLSIKKFTHRSLFKPPNKLLQNSMCPLKDIKTKNKPVTIIHVPLDEKLRERDVATEITEDIILDVTQTKSQKVDSCIQVTDDTKFKNTNIAVDFLLNKVERGTDTFINEVEQESEELPNKLKKETKVLVDKKDQVTEVDQDFIKMNEYDVIDIKKSYDSLDIPNVSLINNNSKSDLPKEDIVDVINKNSDTVAIPIVSHEDEHDFRESHVHTSSSYIISRATLTYTTKQKINLHVVGNNEILQAQAPSSPLVYPMNVVSVYKNEMKNRAYYGNNRKLDNENEDENDKSYDGVEHSVCSASVDCSFVFDNDKLVKPSDIISTIKLNTSLLHSDYICEQFQRELNFIDSFFESLQYLESCSLSEKCIGENEVENWINSSGNVIKPSEFGSFLSKFENEINIDDSTTMASKSLCLLNLLIRDEQRRAKNLLFVLKMREDALKDFTKSQILWLENKKKQDNTDISQLKKKQRGALLKLQHECGEMQRMRKALLTLSEKRKLALMKTKRNIEIKLRNSVDVEQIILGKKKVKRSVSSDRNVAPLKCFELSSSGCEDSTTSRPRSTAPVLLQDVPKSIAEKCVQTSEGTLETVCVERSTDTADENFIVVDGGYLNILFHNLSPQIFSSEKQYEVNKEALNNLVHTSNMQHFNWNNDVAIEELMDQIKNHELERPNTPSTARSLVEEFDQIYKGFAEEKSHEDVTDHARNDAVTDVVSDAAAHVDNIGAKLDDNDVQKSCSLKSSEGVLSTTTDESCMCEPLMVSVETQSSLGADKVSVSVSGPLPVPAGADDVTADVPSWLMQKVLTSSLVDSTTSSSPLQSPSMSLLSSPVNYEAEELRRQQLAIEREIKALEQQQSQLLALREIPDKPPPPYTPPSEPKTSKLPAKFTVDQTVEEKVLTCFSNIHHDEGDHMDPFDVFVKDFCQDAIERHKLEKDLKYWDTCNFPPSKPDLSTDKLISKTTSELKDVLTCVPPTIVSGVGARRSDHIDDILFAEWRRCEPEWTSLHADEVIVKNQVFESIFQKILSETVDEYKRTVVDPKKTDI